MKCCKCGKEITADDAYRCGDCGRDFCERCAESCGICECHGDFHRYS
ncbi:MAG: hypothetical protein HFK08_03740 [Clostridia bacterium]|nr:hypothetical protein [Clostridia bacterium]